MDSYKADRGQIQSRSMSKSCRKKMLKDLVKIEALLKEKLKNVKLNQNFQI